MAALHDPCAPLALSAPSPAALRKAGAVSPRAAPLRDSDTDSDSDADLSPAVRRAVQQARAKRGPVVLIRADNDTDASGSGFDSDEALPALAPAGGRAGGDDGDAASSSSDDSSSSSDEDDESDAHGPGRRAPVAVRHVLPILRHTGFGAASAPAFTQAFPADISGESDEHDDEYECGAKHGYAHAHPHTHAHAHARRTRAAETYEHRHGPAPADVVERYRTIVIHDDQALLQLAKARARRERMRARERERAGERAQPGAAPRPPAGQQAREEEEHKPPPPSSSPRSSTYWTRKEAAVQWIKDQWAAAAQQQQQQPANVEVAQPAPQPEPEVKSQPEPESKSVTEQAASAAPSPRPSSTASASGSGAPLLSSLPVDEQARAMHERAAALSRSLSARRASQHKPAPRLPALERLASASASSSSSSTSASAASSTPSAANPASASLKAPPSPPTASVARITASSPGTPSPAGWGAALRSTLSSAAALLPSVPASAIPASAVPVSAALASAAPRTPATPFSAQCGAITIRITPPTPRAAGFGASTSFKVPGVVLRHNFAPPPGTSSGTGAGGARARQFADTPRLAPPPFDVAPGRNLILQRRAEAQLRQLQQMALAQQQAAAQLAGKDRKDLTPAQAQALVARTVAAAVAARFGPQRAGGAKSSGSASGNGTPTSEPDSAPPSPSAIPDSPLPPRAGQHMPRRASTLQQATAVDAPAPAARSPRRTGPPPGLGLEQQTQAHKQKPIGYERRARASPTSSPSPSAGSDMVQGEVQLRSRESQLRELKERQIRAAFADRHSMTPTSSSASASKSTPAPASAPASRQPARSAAADNQEGEEHRSSLRRERREAAGKLMLDRLSQRGAPSPSSVPASAA